MTFIYSRLDTVTLPKQNNMCEAMFKATVEDDIYEDDITIIELGKYSAFITGNESLYLLQVDPLVNSHIIQHEVGEGSVFSGVQFRIIDSFNGVLDIKKIKSKIRGNCIHFPN